MNFLRRMSTKSDPIDEDYITQQSQRRRKSSIAVTTDEVVLPTAIKPPIEVFPNAVSIKQETLFISPDPVTRGFVIAHASTGIHLLTVVTPASSIPGPSHTRYFYGHLKWASTESGGDRKSGDTSATSTNGSGSNRLCTLTRHVVSLRRRHHVDDPYNGKRLIEIEFTTSSWEAGQLKANIRLLSRYGDAQPMEPARLTWKGRKGSLEGVLEWNNKPAAVCARGEETDEGEYALYVAPGMDLYVACIIVMAVEDRTRRGFDDSSRRNSVQEKDNCEVTQ